MINATAGIKNLSVTADGRHTAFTYMGYSVIMDAMNIHVTRDEATSSHLNALLIGDSVSDRISKGKDIVLEQMGSRLDAERNQAHNETMAKVEETDSREPGDVESYEYRGHRIAISTSAFYDDCPWDDWDGEPSAFTMGAFGASFNHAYGKNKDSINGNPYTGHDLEVWMRYLRMSGAVAEEFNTRSDTYIAIFTKGEVQEHFYGDYNLARHALPRSIETFQAWAEGEVYSWAVYDPNGELIESIGGFYGWKEIPYMLEEAISVADQCANEAEEEGRDMAAEEQSAIESELGPMAALFA